jgi:hypothetical protein
LNWGQPLPLIIGINFGDFGVYIKDCKIRVAILYIWGRKSRLGRKKEPLGRKEHFLQINQFRPWKFWSLSVSLGRKKESLGRKKHFLQINQFRPWKFWSLSAKLVPAYVASDM